MKLEAGHYKTIVGRGLTLNLQEDLAIEKSNLLDGVLLESEFSWLNFKGFAGRAIHDKSFRSVMNSDRSSGEPVILTTANGDMLYLPGYVSVEQQTDNLVFRDNILGATVESYMTLDDTWLSYLSGSSAGVGFVMYATDVGAIEIAYPETITVIDPSVNYNDTSQDQNRYIYYQERRNTVLPSGMVNLQAGDWNLYVEHARMLGNRHQLGSSADTVTVPGSTLISVFDSTVSLLGSQSTYLSLTGALFDVALTAEYKNYHYARDPLRSGSDVVAAFVDPPTALYQHSWQLLTKHLPANMMSDVVGYNLLVQWHHFDPTTVLLDINCGGQHAGENPFMFDSTRSYWETYLEWTQDIGSLVNAKVGIDVGKIDPDQQKELFRTLAAKVNAGPFSDKHSISLVGEFQYNSKDFFAETDSASVRNLVTANVADSLIFGNAFFSYPLVPAELKSRYTQWAPNVLVVVGAHPCGDAGQCERTVEQRLHVRADDRLLVQRMKARIESEKRLLHQGGHRQV